MKKLFLLLLSLFLVCGCGSTAQPSESSKTKLKVFASFYAVYEFTKLIGRDKIELTNVVPPGIEAHDFELTTGDMVSFEKADILFYVGNGMESWVDKVKNSLSNKTITLASISQNIEPLPGEHIDPHTWLDPRNAKIQMETIKNTLVQKDPDNTDYYEANYQAVVQELDKLIAAFEEAQKGFVTKQIVVGHEAYGYLCHALGIEQVAIEGLLADSEPTSARLVEIIHFITDNQIEYIFFEELLSSKVVDTLAAETGVQTLVLNPFESVSDEDQMQGATYFSIMRENLANIQKALN